MKKAQGLPLNTIVIAAIAIIVLIIVVLFFSGKFGQSSAALEDCEAKGGVLKAAASDCPENTIPTPTGGEDKKYCCIQLGSG